MYLPDPSDYIDIHSHESSPEKGVCTVENIMAHESRTPADMPGQPCTYGIHPWYLTKANIDQLLGKVDANASHDNMIAFGEAGFDKLRGASLELQRLAFEEQIGISERYMKPVVIHSVRAWDELLMANKKLKPAMPWLIHGFRGSIELAKQLLSKGMYLSFWFDFALRSESAQLLRALPRDRIFLETDGADVEISRIYEKVASDLEVSVSELKSVIHSNFKEFFAPSR
jgi:TatD DNase family protein